MFPIGHYIEGLVKNLFNQRISPLAIVSSNSYVDKSAYIYRGVKVKEAVIGAHTYIAAYTDVENAEIGKYCSIADHCRIGMSSHSLQYLSTSSIFTQTINALQEKWTEKDVFEQKSVDERVFLGNDVWVGTHALINGGIHIGDGACIAAGAVVVKDVPPYAIVGGVPAKLIRYRFSQEVIEKLEEIRWWDLPEDKIKEHLTIFQKENPTTSNLATAFTKESAHPDFSGSHPSDNLTLVHI